MRKSKNKECAKHILAPLKRRISDIFQLLQRVQKSSCGNRSK